MRSARPATGSASSSSFPGSEAPRKPAGPPIVPYPCTSGGSAKERNPMNDAPACSPPRRSSRSPGPAFAGDIHPVVNVSTELANDLRGLTFAADGKIYASGHVGTVDDETRTVVARFNADGTLDASFGDDGVVEVDVAPGRQEQSLGVAELADGDVVVAVNAVDEDGGQSIYLLRLDGTGAQKIAPAWGDDRARSRSCSAGPTPTTATFRASSAAARHRVGPAGRPQQRRREAGRRSASARRPTAPAAPTTTATSSASTPDGTPDPSFNGGEPFAYHSAGTFADNARRGLIEADGAIVAAGYTNLGDGLGNHVVLLPAATRTARSTRPSATSSSRHRPARRSVSPRSRALRSSIRSSSTAAWPSATARPPQRRQLRHHRLRRRDRRGQRLDARLPDDRRAGPRHLPGHRQ